MGAAVGTVGYNVARGHSLGNIKYNSGTKFVAKQAGGIRKQFLIAGDDVLLAFVQKGKKFADCESFTEVSGDVSCKV